jgi:glycosyltransferase involved in cell wall biosynthesis
VVIFSAQDYWYHNRAHSDIQLARALSDDRPVLLVNSLGMRMPLPGTTSQPMRRVARKIRSTARFARRPEKNHPKLVVMTPASLPVTGSRFGHRAIAWGVGLQVRLVAWLFGIGKSPDVVITLPTAWEAARRLSRRTLIVNRSDRYSSLPEADTRLIREMEEAMLAACDAAVFVSQELMREEEPLITSGMAVFLGHGVDVDHFAAGPTRPQPSDIAAIRRPRIGFFGGIDDYVVDLDLVRRLARETREASIVLVGAATCDMSALTAEPNVHWLGMRPYGDIPAYGAAFDVAIMPWLDSEWIRYCNPIKTKEYLALGLPIVTTDYPEAARDGDVMGVAHSHEEFIGLVHDALAGRAVSDPQSRRARVKDSSWQGRADVLRELCALKGAS